MPPISIGQNTEIILSKHARERMALRAITEEMIKQVIKNAYSIRPTEDEKIKFIGMSRGVRVHVVGDYVMDEDRLVIVTVWVRGEDDDRISFKRMIRRQEPLSRIEVSLLLLIAILLVIGFYYFVSLYVL